MYDEKRKGWFIVGDGMMIPLIFEVDILHALFCMI
jgi:hypothetical protein